MNEQQQASGNDGQMQRAVDKFAFLRVANNTESTRLVDKFAFLRCWDTVSEAAHASVLMRTHKPDFYSNLRAPGLIGPEEIGSFCFQADGNLTFDRSQLKTLSRVLEPELISPSNAWKDLLRLSKPQASTCNLAKDFNTWCSFHDDSKRNQPSHLTPLLQWILHQRETILRQQITAEVSVGLSVGCQALPSLSDCSHGAEFVCMLPTLTSIACTLYDPNKPWALNVVRWQNVFFLLSKSNFVSPRGIVEEATASLRIPDGTKNPDTLAASSIQNGRATGDGGQNQVVASKPALKSNVVKPAIPVKPSVHSRGSAATMPAGGWSNSSASGTRKHKKGGHHSGGGGKKRAGGAKQAPLRRRTNANEANLLRYCGIKFQELAVGPASFGSEHFYSVVESTVRRSEPRQLLVAGKIDCRDAYEDYIEVAARCVVDNEKDFRAFYRKLLDYWLRCYFVGVPKLVLGFHALGDLRGVAEMSTAELPELAGRIRPANTNLWEPSICLNFLDTFLAALKAQIPENDPSAVYQIKYSPDLDQPRHVSQDVEITIQRMSNLEIENEEVFAFFRHSFVPHFPEPI